MTATAHEKSARPIKNLLGIGRVAASLVLAPGGSTVPMGRKPTRTMDDDVTFYGLGSLPRDRLTGDEKPVDWDTLQAEDRLFAHGDEGHIALHNYYLRTYPRPEKGDHAQRNKLLTKSVAAALAAAAVFALSHPRHNEDSQPSHGIPTVSSESGGVSTPTYSPNEIHVQQVMPSPSSITPIIRETPQVIHEIERSDRS
jgi:hypothetical protein